MTVGKRAKIMPDITVETTGPISKKKLGKWLIIVNSLLLLMSRIENINYKSFNRDKFEFGYYSNYWIALGTIHKWCHAKRGRGVSHIVT